MTVHCIHVVSEPGDETAFKAGFSGLRIDLPEAVPEQARDPVEREIPADVDATPGPPDSRGPPDRQKYHTTTLRFETSEPKNELLDSIVARLPKTGVEWYGVYYHECDHDEAPEDRTGCGPWELARSAAPSKIPDEIDKRPTIATDGYGEGFYGSGGFGE